MDHNESAIPRDITVADVFSRIRQRVSDRSSAQEQLAAQIKAHQLELETLTTQKAADASLVTGLTQAALSRRDFALADASVRITQSIIYDQPDNIDPILVGQPLLRTTSLVDIVEGNPALTDQSVALLGLAPALSSPEPDSLQPEPSHPLLGFLLDQPEFWETYRRRKVIRANRLLPYFEHKRGKKTHSDSVKRFLSSEWQAYRTRTTGTEPELIPNPRIPVTDLAGFLFHLDSRSLSSRHTSYRLKKI